MRLSLSRVKTRMTHGQQQQLDEVVVGEAGQVDAEHLVATRRSRSRRAARSGMPEMPFGPAGEAVPVVGRDPEDLAEAEGDDGQVVAPQPQRRRADDQAEQRPRCSAPRSTTSRNGRWTCDRREGGAGEQGAHVGADAEEGDVAEVEQAGQADDDVEADGGDREHADGGEHPDPVGVALLGEREGHGRHRAPRRRATPVVAGEQVAPARRTAPRRAGRQRRPRSANTRHDTNRLDSSMPRPHTTQRPATAPASAGGDGRHLERRPAGGRLAPASAPAAGSRPGGRRRRRAAGRRRASASHAPRPRRRARRPRRRWRPR